MVATASLACAATPKVCSTHPSRAQPGYDYSSCHDGPEDTTGASCTPTCQLGYHRDVPWTAVESSNECAVGFRHATVAECAARNGAAMDGASPYQGGRDLPALQKHVEENLLPKCDAKDPENSGCDDQEIAYIAKMTEKGADAMAKEATRLEGMKGSAMKPDKKAWLLKRINVLKALA